MVRRQFKQLGLGTFFGHLVYRRAVPESHFLRQLEAVIEWEGFTDRLIELYEGAGRMGRPPYDPVVILKMLLLSYLYNLSEGQTEVYANDVAGMDRRRRPVAGPFLAGDMAGCPGLSRHRHARGRYHGSR